jgi:hypothetical protein
VLDGGGVDYQFLFILGYSESRYPIVPVENDIFNCLFYFED